MPFVWSVPFIVVPLLGLGLLFLAPRGRRVLPAIGLVLMLLDGAGDPLLSPQLYIHLGVEVPFAVISVLSAVLNVALAAGFLLLVLGAVRRPAESPARAGAHGRPPGAPPAPRRPVPAPRAPAHPPR
ncbi:hypothetical protein [Streptomonospora nanhaiensis]|nr:hypothetical protein [Streptomonospora nanhaiensis]